MTATALYQGSDDDTRDLLVGRRIVAVEQSCIEIPEDTRAWQRWAEGRLTLDDGTHVYVVPNEGGCSCGAGDYGLTSLATVDNIITSVRLAEEKEVSEYGYEGSTSYRIYVIADAAEINAVQIDGDDGNGYYGTGYELVVVKP